MCDKVGAIMNFKVTSGWGTPALRNTIILYTDNWDDYHFKTTFHAVYCDKKGLSHELGTVKIAKAGMDEGKRITSYLEDSFDELPDGFFSLWQTAEAYRRVLECEKECHIKILKALKDISYNPDLYNRYRDEPVLNSSLFRDVSRSLYIGQFRRIARGEAILTSYNFSYVITNNNPFTGDCSLTFSVRPGTLPPTNIHAIIGSNGTGKTTLIKNMIKSICKNDNSNGMFQYTEAYDEEEGIFENIICISFNPFDDYSDIEFCSKKFKYIGIKKEYEPCDIDAYEDGYSDLSLLDDINNTFDESLKNCLADSTKRDDLREILEMLETECNFISSNYDIDLNVDGLFEDVFKSMSKTFGLLSAGHKVVLSIITRCIDVLVEKSVVFIDEPENHLHPPLLSSLIRGISKMLIKRNGVAIISTHSPIVLQEIPKSSVWIIHRDGSTISSRRPDIETFGTNIGVLTNEIFGYEVKLTGFNTLLKEVVNRCEDYESVLEAFDYQLGDEARSIVRIMLKQKEIQ